MYIYTNLPVDVIVRIPHPRSGDRQGQETFLAPSADKQTCNYDIECSNLLAMLYIYTKNYEKIGRFGLIGRFENITFTFQLFHDLHNP